MTRLLITSAIAALLLTGEIGATQSTDATQRIALLTRYLDALRVQAGIPGLSAAVVANGRIVWDGGFGYADVDRKIPATADTPYAIASITKTFTSTLLMQCVDNGRLNLDESMARYASGLDPTATVRHVLAMTSDSPAGSKYHYDGDRFAALTGVVEACTSAPYRVALATSILDRLAMTDSVPGHDLEASGGDVFDAATLARYRAVIGRLAKPYVDENGRAQLTDYPPRAINAAAGLISTVRDLAKYDVALRNLILTSSASQAASWTNYRFANGSTAPYALGWFAQSNATGQLIWHYGSWPQFSSLLLRVRGRDMTLILLANSNGLSRFPLADGDVMTSPFARAFIAAAQ